MKKILIAALFLISTKATFCQNKNIYGPLPYRTIQETIGEKYIIEKLTSPESIKYGYLSIKKAGSSTPLTVKEAEGKILTLVSIDDGLYPKGHFKDEAGIEYLISYSLGSFSSVVPKADVDNAKAMFLNKTLWLNNKGIIGGSPDSGKYSYIDKLRFQPVTVVDVLPPRENSFPVVFVLKTVAGQIGYLSATVSGTNQMTPITEYFKNMFFLKDPTLTYKFGPAIWKNIKAGWIDIGMPPDAVRLIAGSPKNINAGGTDAHPTEQWVYGEGHQWYVYFKDGKVHDITR